MLCYSCPKLINSDLYIVDNKRTCHNWEALHCTLCFKMNYPLQNMMIQKIKNPVKCTYQCILPASRLFSTACWGKQRRKFERSPFHLYEWIILTKVQQCPLYDVTMYQILGNIITYTTIAPALHWHAPALRGVNTKRPEYKYFNKILFENGTSDKYVWWFRKMPVNLQNQQTYFSKFLLSNRTSLKCIPDSQVDIELA